ncbi:MAG: VWA domain-containing protein [Verrucomicrobiae bacterium]|nr:VWA domain-containing protein [Verrucomicrobiae bacterium]
MKTLIDWMGWMITFVFFAGIPVLREAGAREVPVATDKQPLVQIAILLDTSGSMEGLIEQAKGQLWKIVNEFVSAKRDGKRPEVQVALYEYGNNGLNLKNGWIRRVQPLTTDLDRISEELFKLKTNGGDEFCGWVINDAVKDLEWSKSPDDYKAIFIAGNEPFTQGSVDFRQACKTAIGKGIVVNTIFCGVEREGVDGQWKSGATLADGKYLFIDHNRAVVHFEAPQDREIAELGEKLNATYIAFGAKGEESRARQAAQDANAASLRVQGSMVQRSMAKASANYRNSDWDLVDALKEKKVEISQVSPAALPAEMRSMNEAERKAYVEGRAAERERIQARISQLSVERARYAAEQAKKQDGGATLDAAMIGAIHEQAARKNYRFD